MLRKVVIIVILSAISLLFIGCEKNEVLKTADLDSNKPKTLSTLVADSENNEKINSLKDDCEVEECISVAFPASFFSEIPKEAVKEDGTKLGAKDVVFNDDGSVEYIMTDSNYKRLKDKNLEDLNNAITKFTCDDIKDIDYDKSNSEFKIYSTLNSLDYNHGLVISSLMFFENYRQAIEGEEIEDIDCTVKIVNCDSNEVFYCEKWSSLKCQ